MIGHPSELDGELEEIAEHARSLTAIDGVHGLDLLAYRHRRVDPVALTRAVVERGRRAGDRRRDDHLARADRDVAAAGAWGFTIGGAIFEDRLPGGPGVAGQLARGARLAARRRPPANQA